MRGSEEQFQEIMRKLAENIRSYENRSIAHMRFVETNDNIFSSFGWTKSEYYTELCTRLGISTNSMRKSKLTANAVAKKSAPKKTEIK